MMKKLIGIIVLLILFILSTLSNIAIATTEERYNSPSGNYKYILNSDGD